MLCGGAHNFCRLYDGGGDGGGGSVAATARQQTDPQRTSEEAKYYLCLYNVYRWRCCSTLCYVCVGE